MKEALVHTPEGVRDIYGNEAERQSRILKRIEEVFEKFRFERIEMPEFEYFNIFNSTVGSVPSDLMYKFFDRNNNTLVLRPDFTPQIARCVAKYFETEELPIRLFYTGRSFKNMPLHQGRLSEITQTGCELINDDSSAADAEMLALAIESLKESGLTDFKIEIGEAEYFRGIISSEGIGRETEERIRDLIEKRNFFGLSEYIEGLDISEATKNALNEFHNLFGDIKVLDKAEAAAPNSISAEAVSRLRRVYAALSYYGYEEYVGFDLGMLNDYDYYTGLIFSAYTYGTGDVILSGGRYNNLIGQFGKVCPSIGFAINISELMLGLQRQGLIGGKDPAGVIILYDIGDQKAAVEKASSLRASGTAVSLIRKSKKHSFDEYFEYAEKYSFDKIIYISEGNENEIFDICAR